MSDRDTAKRLKLPKQLLNQLDLQASPSLQSIRQGNQSRKERRKSDRVDKRSRADQARSIQRKQRQSQNAVRQVKDYRPNQQQQRRQLAPPAHAGSDPGDLSPSFAETDDVRDQAQSDSRSENEEELPPAKKTKVSRSIQAKLDEDDREIQRLEKKLGLKGKNKKQAGSDDDGLDAILDGIGDDEPEGSNVAEDAESKAWLQRKREVSTRVSQPDLSEDTNGSEFSGFEESEGSDENATSASEVVDWDEVGSAVVTVPSLNRSKARENPYRPPVVDGSAAVEGKRKVTLSVHQDEITTQLKRKVKGLLNRLSEANFLAILTDFEALYRSNPRQHVTSALIDAIMSQVDVQGFLEDTFIILHAAFVAGITKVIGPEFGAEMVKTVTEQLESRTQQHNGEGAIDKRPTNLMAILAELFNFHVISSDLVYDFVRGFVEDLSELNTELLLKIVKTSGQQLRQEAPTSLKDIVIRLQSTVSAAGSRKMTVRTSFMVDTIMDLKNNRLKATLQATGIPLEHRTRLKKSLGSIPQHKVKTNEPLGITLSDIHNSESMGRWWVVGARYTDEKPKILAQEHQHIDPINGEEIDDEVVDIAALAKIQRMNTEVRRSVFVSIMSATDYQDAYERLLKLRLKKSQESEIAKVLMQCVTSEQAYNPYYALIAGQLCSERRMKMTFQFALWDILKAMLQGYEDNETATEPGGSLDIKPVVHLGKMYGYMVADRKLDIKIVKNIEVQTIQEGDIYHVFLEVFLVTIILQCYRGSNTAKAPQVLGDIFGAARDLPDFAQGLNVFLSSAVLHTDLLKRKSERKMLRSSFKTILVALGEPLEDV